MTVPPPTSLLDDDSGCGSREEICCKNRKLLGVSQQWRRRWRNQLRSPFSLSGVSKRAHSILLLPLPSISLLGTTIGGRYCHCYMHGGRLLQIAPLFNTLAHNNPPSSQIYSDRKKQIIFPRYFSLRPNIRVIIMDLLSSPFLTFFCQISLSTRCNKEFHLQRRSLSIQPLHTPTPYAAPFHPIQFRRLPTHCDCELRLAADCSVTHDTPLFLVPPLSPTDKRTDGRLDEGAKSMREKRGEINLIKRDFISTDFLANV